MIQEALPVNRVLDWQIKIRQLSAVQLKKLSKHTQHLSDNLQITTMEEDTLK